MGAVMNPNTKKRLNGITAKLKPIEKQLNDFITTEQDNISDQEMNWLIHAECSLHEAYTFIQHSK